MRDDDDQPGNPWAAAPINRPAPRTASGHLSRLPNRKLDVDAARQGVRACRETLARVRPPEPRDRHPSAQTRERRAG